MALTPTLTENQLRKQHNGLIKCPIDEVRLWMPDIVPIVESCPLPHRDYVVDAKVHMLMPGQWPCIPGWHGDAVPRNKDLDLLWDECDDDQKLFLWLSGNPLTEFKDGRKIEPRTWIPFLQRDVHRGTQSDVHQWRLFIRLMPNPLVVRPRTGEACIRRHSQVYLSSDFTW